MRNPHDFLLAAEYRGHDGIRRWAEDVWGVFSTMRFELEDLLESGDGSAVVSVQRVVGTTRHTGIPAEFKWSTAYTFADGRIASASGFLTRAEALRAAGLEP